MSGGIYADLGIDYTTMLSDPEGFDKSVREAAEELKTILKESRSVSSYLANLPQEEFDIKPIESSLNEFYYLVDKTVPTKNLTDVASLLRKLASEIEYIAQSRAHLALAETTQGLDKAMAHEMYILLREAHKKWLQAVKTLSIYTAEPLPAMPGNYGSDVQLTKYVFLFEGDDEAMLNWNIVCKRLNLPAMNMMDTVDYVESHPETNCTVTRITK